MGVTTSYRVSFEAAYRIRLGISDNDVKVFEASLADEYENNL